MCRRYGGEVTTLTEEELVGVTELLHVWYHKPYMGNIWLKSKSSNTCQMILVSIANNLLFVIDRIFPFLLDARR